ncbi:unnamed protein product [Ectocarpus sp. 6 AP-2014]
MLFLRAIVLFSPYREHKKRPCVSCFKWSTGYIPIPPPVTSRFGTAFSCEMCCVACVACGEATSVTMSKCGVCQAKTLAENQKAESEMGNNFIDSDSGIATRNKRLCAGSTID